MDLQPLKSPLNRFLDNIFAKLLIPKFSLLPSIICASSSHQIQIFPYSIQILIDTLIEGTERKWKKTHPIEF